MPSELIVLRSCLNLHHPLAKPLAYVSRKMGSTMLKIADFILVQLQHGVERNLGLVLYAQLYLGASSLYGSTWCS